MLVVLWDLIGEVITAARCGESLEPSHILTDKGMLVSIASAGSEVRALDPSPELSGRCRGSSVELWQSETCPVIKSSEAVY